MSIDAISYRVWNASTGKWARSANKVDDVMFVTEETNDPCLAATWSFHIAVRIVRDGLHQGKRLHEVAVDHYSPSPAPVPVPGVEIKTHLNPMATIPDAQPPAPLPATIPGMKAMWDRLEAHEVCLDGHRKSLCAVIERLDKLGKAPGKVADVPDPRMQSPRDMCRKYSIQACHYCERLACGDNTSPGGALYRAAKALVDQPGGARATTVPDLIDAIKVVEAMG